MCDLVPFNYVTKESGIDVATQEFETVTRIDALRFGKAAARQVGVQCLVQNRTFPLRPPLCVRGWFQARVPQDLAKAEWVDQDIHGPATHAGRDLPTKQASR